MAQACKFRRALGTAAQTVDAAERGRVATRRGGSVHAREEGCRTGVDEFQTACMIGHVQT